MAVSTTTFQQRLARVNSGRTTCWTVPGQGLASRSDERRFLSRSAVKMRRKSTQTSRGPLIYLVALIIGASSVIAARWIDFTYLDTALAFAAAQGVDTASLLGNVPTALSLAVLISVMAMLVLGLRSRRTVALQGAGFLGAFVFEADLVAFAPAVYARFYPSSWINEMVASASLLS